MSKAVNEIHQFAPGAYYWETFSEEIKADLSCSAWRDDLDVALIDPVPLTMKALDRVVQRADYAVVLLTTANHERGAEWFWGTLHLEVWAHRAAERELTVKGARYFEDGATLVAGLQAIHLPGSSASETAYYTPKHGGIVFIGDALVNMESLGGLAFLPDKYSQDPKKSRESLRKLLALDFQMMTFGHGKPIVRDAKKRLAALLGEA